MFTDGVGNSGSNDFSQVIDLEIEGSIEEFNEVVEALGLKVVFEPFSGLFVEVVVEPIVESNENKERLLGVLGKSLFELLEEFQNLLDSGSGEILSCGRIKIDFG
jgi:hypothetical protein